MNYLGLSLCHLILITVFFGINRHDVDKKSYLRLVKEKEFDCLGQIYKDTVASGSAVLIADRFVLSAAHVFIDSETRPDTTNYSGTTVVVYVPFKEHVVDAPEVQLKFGDRMIKAKSLKLHPNFRDNV